jgi:hypothetical protein
MPQNVEGSNGIIPIQKQSERIIAIKENNLESPVIEVIKANVFAPELLPHLNNPAEVQDLRQIENADKKDIEEWVETAVEVLPEIHTDHVLA